LFYFLGLLEIDHETLKDRLIFDILFYFLGLLEIDCETLKDRLARYAVCPTCYNSLPLPSLLNHFSVEECAKHVIDGLPLLCPTVTLCLIFYFCFIFHFPNCRHELNLKLKLPL